jgi:hypothetical protein
MAGTQALVALPKGGGGGYEVQTFDIEGYSLSAPGKLKYPATDLAAEVAADGRVSVFGKLALQNGTAEVNQVWQVGPVSSGSMVPHAMSSDNKAAMGKLNLLTGAATSSGGGGSNLRKKNVSTLQS